MSSSRSAKIRPIGENDDEEDAQTRPIPAEVVRLLLDAADPKERPTLSPSELPPAPAPAPRPLPSGTRRRITPEEIASFIVEKTKVPRADPVEDLPCFASDRPTPVMPNHVARRMPIAPLPVQALPPAAYPAPKVEARPQPTPLLEQPLLVLLVASSVLIAALGALTFLLLR